jgi:hypothetical protein
MQTTFITGIHIDKVRHLTNVDIALSENERKHSSIFKRIIHRIPRL